MGRSAKFRTLLLFFSFLLLACSAGSLLPASHSVAVEPGAVLFYDDFSNPLSGWNTWYDPVSMAAYQEGIFRILITQANYDSCSRSGKEFTDVHLEVEATHAAGPSDNDFGLVCRYVDRNNFYAFLISSDGYAGIVRVLDGIYEILGGQNMQYNELVLSGRSMNRLEAVCIGPHLAFFVNGQKVLEAQDSNHAAGEVGLMAGAYDEPGVDIVFDNFIARKP